MESEARPAPPPPQPEQSFPSGPQAFYARPTWRQRLNQRLGFTFPFEPDLYDWRSAEEPGFAPSAMVTHVKVRVSFLDRLRLLLTGLCEIEVSTKTDVIVNRAQSRSRFRVCPFGDGPPRPPLARRWFKRG